MAFFSNKRFRFPNNGVDEVSACAIQNNTREMLRQMALPLIPERRVKGALSLVSRETGLPFSKVRRIYYGITDHILAFEFSAIEAAHDKWLCEQERRLGAQIENLRAARAAKKQGRLALNENTTNAPRLSDAVEDMD